MFLFLDLKFLQERNHKSSTVLRGVFVVGTILEITLLALLSIIAERENGGSLFATDRKFKNS